MSLGRGRLGNLRGMLRVRMDLAHREMAECEAELVPERPLQSTDNIQCSAAVRTFEVAIFDQRDQRRARSADVVVRAYWIEESGAELRNHRVVPLRGCLPAVTAPDASATALINPKATRPTLSATKTKLRLPVKRSASRPPPTAIVRRVKLASTAQRRRPKPWNAKYSPSPRPKNP